MMTHCTHLLLIIAMVTCRCFCQEDPTTEAPMTCNSTSISKKLDPPKLNTKYDKLNNFVLTRTTFFANCSALMYTQDQLFVFKDDKKLRSYTTIEDVAFEKCIHHVIVTSSFAVEDSDKSFVISCVIKSETGESEAAREEFFTTRAPCKPTFVNHKDFPSAGDIFDITCQALVPQAHGYHLWTLQASDGTSTYKVLQDGTIQINRTATSICVMVNLVRVRTAYKKSCAGGVLKGDHDDMTDMRSLMQVRATTRVHTANFTCTTHETDIKKDQAKFQIRTKLEVHFEMMRPKLKIIYGAAPRIIFPLMKLRGICEAYIGSGFLVVRIKGRKPSPVDNEKCEMQQKHKEPCVKAFKVTPIELTPQEKKSKLLGTYLKIKFEVNASYQLDKHKIECATVQFAGGNPTDSNTAQSLPLQFKVKVQNITVIYFELFRVAKYGIVAAYFIGATVLISGLLSTKMSAMNAKADEAVQEQAGAIESTMGLTTEETTTTTVTTSEEDTGDEEDEKNKLDGKGNVDGKVSDDDDDDSEDASGDNVDGEGGDNEEAEDYGEYGDEAEDYGDNVDGEYGEGEGDEEYHVEETEETTV